jgi:predicted transcriptional regulator
MSYWKRGFLEIIGEILESLIGSPLKKTHISFRCNLDSRAVTKYLSVMIYVGLVEISKKDSTLYVITQKGITYRNQFYSFISIMERDLESFPMKNYYPKELIADLKIRKQ